MKNQHLTLHLASILKVSFAMKMLFCFFSIDKTQNCAIWIDVQVFLVIDMDSSEKLAMKRINDNGREGSGSCSMGGEKRVMQSNECQVYVALDGDAPSPCPP